MLTTRQVAERLGCAEISVRIWARQGRFPNAVRETEPIEHWRIPASDLKGFKWGKTGRPRKALNQ
ncbi:MAG TPA: helix-turn-helix domain-containing protein [Blastocatellia bacterium]